MRWQVGDRVGLLVEGQNLWVYLNGVQVRTLQYGAYITVQSVHYSIVQAASVQCSAGGLCKVQYSAGDVGRI